MSEHENALSAIGEVMVEMARGSDGRFGMAAAATPSTPRSISRARGIEVAYATALGDDPYSDGIVALASAEGVGDRPDPARARRGCPAFT